MGIFFLLIGVLLILLGVTAALLPFFAFWLTIKLLGVLLIVSGIAHGVAVFLARTWNGAYMELFKTILALTVGYVFVRYPADTGLFFVWFLAIYLIVGGLFRIFGSMLIRTPHWGVALFSGIVSFILGLMVVEYIQNSEQPQWILGIFIAVDLIFEGGTCVSLGMILLARRAALSK
jgi:uncharacterized membrane protein HdeD (DUF308 family)